MMFTDPFRYIPHPLVRKAAGEVMDRLDRMIASGEISEDIANGFLEGKMLGVLVCHSPEERSDEGGVCLAAFSGSVGGTGIVDGFVPPVFDLNENGGYYRTHEAEISKINKEIEDIQTSEYQPVEISLNESRESFEQELSMMKARKKEARTIAESQFANGQIKRTKDKWKATISELENQLQEVRDKLKELKSLRAQKSDELQRWIFSQYIVHNANGEKASILEIFQNQGIMPPGGTGDCAAPKLLNYAYRHGLKPMAMGEFWYGRSPATAVRTHGHFYPSCTSKCGPLLSFMLNGLTPSYKYERALKIEVIFEDEAIVAASKPSGMPSVPGLDGRESLQEHLEKELRTSLHPVHRLDMDTSGIIIFAKTPQAEVLLKKQFEEHSVRKTYMARLSPADRHRFVEEVPELKIGDKGSLELPLSADYDERPRQKVDLKQGKPSLTEYKVTAVNEDGTTDILFHPHTGRTHQLRVHSAHVLGLGRPILGDLLYGGNCNAWTCTPSEERLHLHALSITFIHPCTGETLTFSTMVNSY